MASVDGIIDLEARRNRASAARRAKAVATYCGAVLAVAGVLALLGQVGVLRIPWLPIDDGRALEARVGHLEKKVDELPAATADAVVRALSKQSGNTDTTK